MIQRGSLLSALLAVAFLIPLAWPTDARAQGTPTVGQDIAYASGGIGIDEREEMQTMAADYSLKLAFAVAGSGAYVSDVSVTIQRDEEPVFQVADVGPWLLVKLPAGGYRVIAVYGEHTKEATVEVPATGLAEAVLAFPES